MKSPLPSRSQDRPLKHLPSRSHALSSIAFLTRVTFVTWVSKLWNRTVWQDEKRSIWNAQGPGSTVEVLQIWELHYSSEKIGMCFLDSSLYQWLARRQNLITWTNSQHFAEAPNISLAPSTVTKIHQIPLQSHSIQLNEWEYFTNLHIPIKTHKTTSFLL